MNAKNSLIITGIQCAAGENIYIGISTIALLILASCQRSEFYNLKKNAEEGNAGAQYLLGFLYFDGVGVPQDYSEALNWWKKSAGQDFSEAQNNLGIVYRDGIGVPQDYSEAFKWFRKAAEEELSEAQYNLGDMYHNGIGTDKNTKKALNYYTKAAEQGHADAQYRIGHIYQYGEGVPKDYLKALMWYNISSIYGNKHALKGKDEIANKLRPAEINEACKMAEEWMKLNKNEIWKACKHSCNDNSHFIFWGAGQFFFFPNGGSMKRISTFIASIAFIALFCPGFSVAAERPINLSLWDTVQLFPSTDSVRGLRLSVYGVNQNVTGIDLGIVPRVTSDFMGAQFGVVGIVENDFIGYQGSFVNLVYGNFTGLQTGFGNITDGHVSGIQWAVFNRAFSVKGVQIGLINITDWLQGVQLGLLNLNNTPSHPFPMLPLINWSF